MLKMSHPLANVSNLQNPKSRSTKPKRRPYKKGRPIQFREGKENVDGSNTELNEMLAPVLVELVHHTPELEHVVVDMEIDAPPPAMAIPVNHNVAPIVHVQPPRPVNVAPERDYFFDAYTRLLELEERSAHTRVLAPIHNDSNLLPTHRMMVLDWLCEVSKDFALATQTQFLGMHLFAQCVHQIAIPKTGLQLVGVACLFMAAKFQEIMPPPITQFVAVTMDQLTCEGLRKLELELLYPVLDGRLCVPTFNDFFECYMPPDGMLLNQQKATFQSLRCLLAELFMFDIRSWTKSTSRAAAAITYLSLLILQVQVSELDMMAITTFALHDLHEELVLVYEIYQSFHFLSTGRPDPKHGAFNRYQQAVGHVVLLPQLNLEL